ncbi:thyroid receptor-interacting protein 11-like isoform X3 [Argonauta hians]
MSWLGGSISSLTGQLSNLTKDILTEGTEEVSDHVTELHLAQKKIQELETFKAALKSENDWLKKINKDLEDKAECSELQINSISREYRAVLENKEKENQLLKHQNHELQEANINTVVTEEQSSIPGYSTTFHEAPLNSGFVDDSLDFGENINLQYEVNRLRSNVQRLESECKHWKGIASQRNSKGGEGESSQVLADIAKLQNKNKELSKQFHCEKERHHDEVSALQNMYSQKIKDLKKTYQGDNSSKMIKGGEDEDQMKKQLQRSEDEINRLKDLVGSLEGTLQQHKMQSSEKSEGAWMESVTAAAAECLEDEMVNYRDEKGEGDYKDTVESLRIQIADLKNQNQGLLKENGQLKKHLDVKPVTDLGGNLSWDHYDELENSSNGLPRTSLGSFEDRTEQSPPPGDSNLGHYGGPGTETLEDQMRALQRQVEKYETEIEQFECLKTDWQLEKEALEDVLMNLRNQLKAKESSTRSGQDQAELCESELLEKSNDEDISIETAEYLLDKAAASMYPLKMGYMRGPRPQAIDDDEDDASSDFSVDIEKFDRQVALLTQANADLERDREYLLQEKHQANDEINYFKNKVASLQQKYDEKVKAEKQFKEKLKELTYTLSEKDQEISKLISDKEDIQSSLIELDSQHQEAIGQLIANRQELARNLKEKSSNIEQLQSEQNEIQLQLDGATDTIAEQRKELNDMTAERDKLLGDVTEMKTKLEETAYAINELHLDKKELIKKMSNKAHKLNSEIEKLSMQNKDFEVENQELQKKLSEPPTSVDVSEIEFQNKCLDKELQNLKESLKEYAEMNRMNEMKLSDYEDKYCNLLKEFQQVKKENIENIRQCSFLKEKNKLQEMALEKIKDNKVGSKTDSFEEIASSSSKNLSPENTDNLNVEELVECTEESLKESLETDSFKQFDTSSIKSKLTGGQITDISATTEEYSQMLCDKCDEVEALRSQVLQLKKDLESTTERLKEFEDISKRNEELEEQVVILNRTNTELNNEMANISANTHNKDSSDNYTDSKTSDSIVDLESELLSSKDKIKSLEKMVSNLEASCKISVGEDSEDNNLLGTEEPASVVSLQAKLDKDEHQLKYFQNILQHISGNLDLETLKGVKPDVIKYLMELKMRNLDQDEAENNCDKGFEKLDDVCDPESMKCFPDRNRIETEMFVQNQTSSQVSNENTQFEELEKLQIIVSEKDSIIEELQSNNAMLLKMIESKSLSVYGDKSLLELHQLSNNVKDLKLEKEQMISVMDEKTRECSSLKAEVHRLMTIVSEERNAIDHLQVENQQLLQSQNKVVVANDDSDAGTMQKEALQKLSNIIRDKDVEIDALKQKNKTLLTIFQDSSQSGPQINSLIQDKENLKKQLGVIQAERDQIGSYLNQKHQESVAYHNEIQRMNVYIQNEAEKYDKLKCEHDKLMPLYEDRSQMLIKAQNDLVNYKQKYSELETKYDELVQRSNISDTVDVITYNNKVEETNSLQERLSKAHATLTEQEQKIQGQLHCNNDTERLLRETELERNNLKKQHDSLTFQFGELERQLQETKAEMCASQQLQKEHSTEISTLKDINNKLSLSIQQKEFELRNVTEKSNTVMSMLQKEQGERSELNTLLQESESIRQQAIKFQQERDQVILSMRNLQAEKEEMTKEMQNFQNRNDKQVRELERLKMHLLQVEEAYTKEALESEDREKNLRNKLAAVEEKAFISAAAVESAGQQSSVQIESLNQQLHAIAAQRDNAYMQLATFQEQCKQYATSVMNLQMVLEQFQAERESQMSAEKQKNEAEQNRLKALVQKLQSDLQETLEKLSDAEAGLQAAERLSEQIDIKMDHIDQLKFEVEEKEKLLKEADQEIHRLKFDSEAFVDKLVMKNLLINYLSTTHTKKTDVLRLIGGILEFSAEDFSKAEGIKKSWVMGFFQTTSIPASVSPGPSPSKFNKSFSELFVNFLEQESTPPPPALRMKTESVEKEVRNNAKAKKESHDRNFNPFTAPRHVAMPIPINDHLSTQGQHLLMAPMAPNFPVLSPISSGTSQTSQSPHVGLMSSSSSILSDVLKQKS